MNKKGSGTIRADGYIQVGGENKNEKTYAHILAAEKALGRSLPRNAVVHHVNEKSDNKNLVICPDQKYHQLLHRRMRALEAGYPAHYLWCNKCKNYGDPSKMRISKDGKYYRHRSHK